VKAKPQEEFFDDCPICQVLKKAKNEGRAPNLAELKEAFKKAKEQGAIVGGSWFSNDNEDAG